MLEYTKKLISRLKYKNTNFKENYDMIQVVKREFEKLDESVKYINNTSISYDYLKDYQIIKEDDKYNVLLNFDIPTEVCQYLELARFKIVRDKSCRVYKTTYNIEVEEQEHDRWPARIFFDDIRKGVQMQGYFDFKSINTFFTITYDWAGNYFIVELRKYDFERSILGWHTDVDKVLFMKEIDYKVIYNHVIKLLLNRGYLIDKLSLDEFKEHVSCIAQWLNRKEFDDYTKPNSNKKNSDINQ